MIARLVRWCRLVMPPWWAVTLAIVAYVICEAPYLILYGRFGFGEPLIGLLRARDSMAVLAAVSFGAFRGLAFHPAFSPGYYKWLRLTPWDYRKPLPLGPVHLTIQDFLLLALLRLSLHDFQLHEAALLTVFLWSYLAAIGTAFLLTRFNLFAYGTFFGLGAVLWRGAAHPIEGLEVAAALYLAAWAALRVSLARFPWEAQFAEVQDALRRATQRNSRVSQDVPRADREFELTPELLGWPFNALYAKRAPSLIGAFDRVCLSLLAGWWMFVVLSILPWRPRDTEMVALAIMSLATICGMLRLIRYCGRHGAPINLWGRIWTGRWVIPAYDCVFIAPACALLVGVAGMSAPSVLLMIGWRPDAVVNAMAIWGPAAISLIFLITALGGPEYQRWRLTGPKRLVPGAGKQMFDEI